jgi:hypothetical protein
MSVLPGWLLVFLLVAIARDERGLAPLSGMMAELSRITVFSVQ